MKMVLELINSNTQLELYEVLHKLSVEQSGTRKDLYLHDLIEISNGTSSSTPVEEFFRRKGSVETGQIQIVLQSAN